LLRFNVQLTGNTARAKDHLRIVVPQRFYANHQRANGDRHLYAVRTRFIPDSIIEHFEQCAWPSPERNLNSSPKAGIKSVDIAARIKSSWR
jgi:DNA helicase-2/ATP-dependent DNA helicase PcrA